MRRPANLALVTVLIALGGLAAPALAQAKGKGGGGGICHVPGGVPVVGPALELGCEIVASPGGAFGAAWHALNGLLGGLPKSVSEAAGHLIAGAASTVLDGVSGWIASGALWLMSKVAGLVVSTTSPDVTANWFARPYGTLTQMAWLLAGPLLMIALIRGALMRDWGELLRPVFWYLPLAAVMTAGAVLVTQMAIRTSDAMSSMVASGLGTNVHAFFVGATKGLILVSAAGAALPSFLIALFAIFVAMAAFAVWIELLLRSAAIYVVVLFLPLAFIAMLWPRMAIVARRMVELLAAVIWSKFVIVAIVAMAADALVHAGPSSHVDATLSAIVLLGMAVFAPWSLLRLIPLMEAGVAHAGHLGDHSQSVRERGRAQSRSASETIKQSFRAHQDGGEAAAAPAPSAGLPQAPLSAAGPMTAGASSGGGAGGGAFGAGAAAGGAGKALSTVAGGGVAAAAVAAPVVAGAAAAKAARGASRRAGERLQAQAPAEAQANISNEQGVAVKAQQAPAPVVAQKASGPAQAPSAASPPAQSEVQGPSEHPPSAPAPALNSSLTGAEQPLQVASAPPSPVPSAASGAPGNASGAELPLAGAGQPQPPANPIGSASSTPTPPAPAGSSAVDPETLIPTHKEREDA